MEVSGQLHVPYRLTTWETTSCTYWTGGWVGPRVSLDDKKKRISIASPGIEPQFFCHPARRLISKTAESLLLQVVMVKGNGKEKERREKQKNEAENFHFFV
jgi:hypothetical protein